LRGIKNHPAVSNSTPPLRGIKREEKKKDISTTKYTKYTKEEKECMHKKEGRTMNLADVLNLRNGKDAIRMITLRKLSV